MSDVFISYSRRDLEIARRLAEALGRDECNVWWDPQIEPGTVFRTVIEQAIDAAQCVIVLWSRHAVQSDFVRAEAGEGLAQRKLIPASLGPVRLPPPFGEYHTIDLSGWQGDRTDPRYQLLLQAVRGRLGQTGGTETTLPLPEIDPHRFSVAVARIQNDVGDELQELITSDLAGSEGIYVFKIAREIAAKSAAPEDERRATEHGARALLEEIGATILVWGKVIRFGGRAVPELSLTVSRGRGRPPGRYNPNHELRLPRMFWGELSEVLGMTVLTLDAQFKEREGAYLGEVLGPFADRVGCLLASASDARGWSDEARGLARIALGEAQLLLGSQRGDSGALAASIATFEAAIDDLVAAGAPRDRARAENGLGIASWILGDREGNLARIERAIEACAAAAASIDRERDPLEWAQAENDLGNALLAASRHRGTLGDLERAVGHYRRALTGRTRTESPLDWAQTRNNLGVALWHLGDRTGQTEQLDEARRELAASLEVYDRSATPLDWAQTHNNLGLVCWSLGRETGDAAHFRAAIGHYRNALLGRRRAEVPLFWAQTQNNLGLAFWSSGEAEDNERRFVQAVRAFHRALEVLTPKNAPSAWAEAQNNLGAALWSMGIRSDGTEALEAAVAAYHHAGDACGGAEQGGASAALRRHNLGNALAELGRRRSDRAQLETAAGHLEAARDLIGGDDPCRRATLETDLALARLFVGELFGEAAAFRTAARAFRRASEAFAEADRADYAEACLKQAELADARAEQADRS